MCSKSPYQVPDAQQRMCVNRIRISTKRGTGTALWLTSKATTMVSLGLLGLLALLMNTTHAVAPIPEACCINHSTNSLCSTYSCSLQHSEQHGDQCRLCVLDGVSIVFEIFRLQHRNSTILEIRETSINHAQHSTMTSDTLIGVAAVIGAWITFGSFGVFIKVQVDRTLLLYMNMMLTVVILGEGTFPLCCTQTPAVVKANVDPLVFQTYKTAAVFLSSWLVLLYRPFYFSYWGIIGAIIWVPAGAGAVTAVRYAGLGVSQGIWSGISGAGAAVRVLLLLVVSLH